MTLILYFFSVSLLSSQNTNTELYLLKSDAPNYNNFKSDPQLLEQLEYFSEKIYPQGRILLDINKSDEFDINDIPQMLGADPNSTFVLESKHRSLLNPESFYYKYQQYHQGVIVDGGGYTILRAPWETDPCASVEFISPAINSHIQIPTTPSIGEEQLSEILNVENIENVSISITHNLLKRGLYNLTWKGHYHSNGQNLKFWIDAHSGEVLHTVETDDYLLAPMEYENYPAQLLDDSQDAQGLVFLESEDGRLRTVDGGNITELSIDDYGNFPVPFTNTGSWFDTTIPSRVFQTHHAASEALRICDELEFGFADVNVMSLEIFGAYSLDSGSPLEAYIAMGTTGDASSPTTSAYDIVAHEFGHAFLNTFLSNNSLATISVEEAIADMIGAYTESRIENDPFNTNNSTWVMGDDNPALEAAANRDLSNPIWTTFDEVKDFESQHDRSVPLGHWFFLISEGAEAIPEDGFDEIPELGIEQAIILVRDAVIALQNSDIDYPDFRESVVALVSNTFGFCSDETTAVIRAFNRIGLGSDGTCDYRVYESPYYCEEEGFVLCVEGAADEFEFEWFFPNFWTVNGAGNTGRIKGRCLYVSSISPYNYYPITRTVTLRNQTSNIPDITIDIIIADCDGDDPICQEVNPGAANIYEESDNTQQVEFHDLNIAYLKVFNIMGELIFEGDQANFLRSSNSQEGILIISYFDSNHQLIRSEKTVILK